MNKSKEVSSALQEIQEQTGEKLIKAAEADELYGDGRPFSFDVASKEAQGYKNALEVNYFELGKRLLWIKENIEHGRFIEFIEDNLKMYIRSAQNCMSATRRLITDPSFKKQFGDLPKSKQRQLLALPPEQVDEFAEQIDTKGISLRQLQKELDDYTRKTDEKIAKQGDSNRHLFEENQILQSVVNGRPKQSEQEFCEIIETRLNLIIQDIVSIGRKPEELQNRTPRERGRYVAFFDQIKRTCDVFIAEALSLRPLTPAEIDEILKQPALGIQDLFPDRAA